MAQSTRGKGQGRRSTSKATTSSKTRTTKSVNKKAPEPMSDELLNEISLIIICAIALFLFLCNIFGLGSFGKLVSDFTFGIFGLLNYIMPILVAFLVIFALVNFGDSIAKRKIIASTILYLMLAMSCELISNTPSKEIGYSFKDIYGFAANNHKGGGILGGSLAYLGVKYLDILGSILLILVVSIICIIIISNRSFVNTVKNGSYKAYEKGSNSARRARARAERAKENNLRRKEERREKLEAKRLREEEIENNKILTEVSGVKTYNFVSESELNETNENVRDDIHEINLTNLDEEYDNRRIDIKIHSEDIVDENDNLNEIFSEQNIFEGHLEANNDDYGYNDYEEVEDSSDFVEDDIIDPFADEDAPKPIAKVNNNFNRAMGESIFASSDHTLSNGAKTFTDNSASATIEKPKPKKVIAKPYKKPPLSLLKKGTSSQKGNGAELRATASKLEEVLGSFGVKVKVTDISQGPSVTRYEMIPETGVKVSKIVSLADDIKLNLAAADIRIEAPIPGKAAIGIEVPNKESQAVLLRDLLESNEFSDSKSTISFAVGKDLAGKVVVADIGKMPHMLIAGATGSGKSVCINTLIMSILYKATPDEVKLIMIDPKVVELSVYNNIPHLLIPVVTDPKKASASLAWAVSEMNDRYQKFAEYGVRDIKGYNEKIKNETDENGNPLKQMFKLIVIVDELADMMMVAGKEVEESICRLAQLARAAGIHLILATQRPSVDVITGLIKANMPSRVSFAVSSGTDSRTILDMNGAEKLLGKGDMLFYPQGYTKPARVQGAFVSDEEVSAVVEFLKNQQLGNIDDEDISSKINSIASSSGSSSSSLNASSATDSDMDEYFVEAGRIIVESGKCSIGMLQRKFKIGFNRAARIMDSLSDYNVVGPDEGTKPRTILMSPEEFEEFVNQL